ncbi:MAG: MFS transporter, partial [Caldilineaceae bacterium]|nr:MFS transporter [Caldilineaceae bacterium]
GLVQVWHVVALAAVLGIVNAFDGPARQAFVVDMVGRQDMPNAIAINSIMFNSARIFGPAIGGLLLAQVGSAWCFLLNGLTFIAVIIGLLMMRLPKHAPKFSGLSPLAQLRSGVIYAAQRDDVKALLLMALSLSLFGITYSTVLPAFVDQVLGRGASAFGAINAASGVGAICAAVMIARNGDKGGRGAWLGRLAIFFPVVLILFANNTNYMMSLGLAVLLGIGFMAQFTLINTLLQTSIADEMRGRVMSLYTLTFFGLTPFGNLAMGAVAERWGLSLAISVSAALALCMSAIVLFKSPKLRALA